MSATTEFGEDHTQVHRERTVLGSARSAVVGRLVLGYAIAASFVPVNPTMPQPGLDPSWKVAVNRATAEGLHFGQDVVFTYGPYGGVLTGVYEPGIRLLTLAAAILVASGYVTAALFALRPAAVWVHPVTAAAVVVLTSAGPQGLDTVALVYPLVVVTAIPQLPERPLLRLSALASMGVPLGLLPHAKLSVVPTVVAALVMGILLLLRRRDWAGVTTLSATPVVSLIVGWIAAHQPLGGLGDYVRNSWYIVSGYSEAMAFPETSRFAGHVVTVAFVVGAALLVAVGLVGWREPEWRFQLVMVALTLFLVFKAGFVRADSHMQAGAIGLLAAAAAVGVRAPAHESSRSRRGLRTGVSAAAVAAVICWLSGPVVSPVTQLRARTTTLAGAVLNGDVSSAALDRRYDAAMRSIRKLGPIPPAEGPSDLYPSSLNQLFASGTTWDPRPVIQSYSAYTPELAQMNARHLQGRAAPRTVFFQVAPIDGRLAGLDDGASWLPMLQHYDVTSDSTPEFLVLRHRNDTRHLDVTTSRVLHGRIGERLTIPPATGSAWLARFDVGATLVGKLRTALWKPPQMMIEVELADGTTDVKRFVPTMAQSEFVLSPYISDTASLRSIFPGQEASAPRREVTAIRLEVESADVFDYWKVAYSVHLRSVAVAP